MLHRITHCLHNTLNIIYIVYIYIEVEYFTRKRNNPSAPKRKTAPLPLPLSTPQKFEIRRITTGYKAFPARVSLAALCGCLVNLWSVHARALRALTRDRNVCVPLRPLAPRPQCRTASLSGPMAYADFSRLSHFSGRLAVGQQNFASRSAEEFRGNSRAIRGAKGRDSRRTLGRSGDRRTVRHCKADRNVSSSASDATIMIHGSPSLDRHIPDASVASRTRLSAVCCYRASALHADWNASREGTCLCFFINDFSSFKTDDDFIQQSNDIVRWVNKVRRQLSRKICCSVSASTGPCVGNGEYNVIISAALLNCFRKEERGED